MLIYNFLEYSDNYFLASQSFWNHYRDEANNVANENNPGYKQTTTRQQ